MPEDDDNTTPSGPLSHAGTTEEARNGERKRRDPSEPTAVVGLGASAGGVAALQQFFSDMSPNSNLAFVVVMHLSPDFESQLANVIQQKTSMPVIQVTEPVRVRPNHIYVIPPNHQLTFVDSMLESVPPQQATGRRVTIDLFFRALAHVYGQRAVCVILSGSDSDGVIGLKHIRAQGGLTIAQDPNEAEFESMPASAISTGMVDWVLPVARMPEKLLEFVKNESAMQLPPEIPEVEDLTAKVSEAPGGETVSKLRREARDEDALQRVLADLRAQSGQDFSYYKRATVLRRIARRLQVNSLETIPQYLEFLRTHPAELRALLQDFLIGVTHFFRDDAAFEALETHIPQLFAGKDQEEEVRVWVAGCATGEEAYSIAILLLEQCKRLENPPRIQVFATDIDDESMADARAGLYSSTIEADVSPERLREFFAHDQGRYRVRNEIRERVLFAKHNLLTDAPFSHCDLISCRNLLIYLKPHAQAIVFDIFHYALRPGGLLFIGGAEHEDAGQTLFSPVDTKNRIFVRRSTPRPHWRVPVLPARPGDVRRRVTGWGLRPLPALTHNVAYAAAAQSYQSVQAGHLRREVLFGELHLRMLEQYGPPSVVVNDAQDIVHLSESAGRYLQFVAGEPTANIIKVVHPELQIELRAALFKADREKATVRATPTAVAMGDGTEVITMEVRPMSAGDEAAGFFLVLFTRESDAAAPRPPEPLSTHDSRDADEEIHYLKQQLATTVEQYEAGRQELQASNEELQAMNEEMRSATEELETSKEELQSVNEELITVNAELKSSVEDLSRANSDLNNLMAATDIGTIFLDRERRILRFTPAAQKVFNLIEADLGRSIADITNRLHDDDFAGEVEKVLQTLQPIEREVRVGNGKTQWYLVRIAPYRTTDDHIAGAFATFLNITELKRVNEALRASEQRLQRIVNVRGIGVLTFDHSGAMLSTNDAFLEMVGYTREEFESRTRTWLDFTPPEHVAKTTRMMEQVRKTGRGGPYEKEYIRKDGTRIWLMLVAADLGDGTIAKYVVDISDRKRVEEALRESEEWRRLSINNSNTMVWEVNPETGENRCSENAGQVMGFPVPENVEEIFALIHAADRDRVAAQVQRAMSGQAPLDIEHRVIHPQTGEIIWIRAQGQLIAAGEKGQGRFVGVTQNLTKHRQAEEALRASEERFRLLVDGARDYAMFLLDPANIITFWSKGAERIFGWTREEAVGQSGNLIFTPEDRKKDAVEKEIAIALREGRSPDKRFHLRKDGTRFWADGVLMRLDEEDGTLRGFAKIARDATDQKEADEALQHAKDEMEQNVVDRTRDLLATNSELERTIEQRQQLEKDLLQISERERRRIGEDLHDIVCQELTATALFLKSTSNQVSDEAATAALNEAAQIVNHNVKVARDLARGYQPVVVGPGGLTSALRNLCNRANAHPRITCKLKLPKAVRIRDEITSLNLFRIAQEAVTNALKHSGGTELTVCLEREGDTVRMVVEDNGKGFRKKKRSKGLGMHIMNYRAGVLRGSLKIEPSSNGGTRVVCEVPVGK